MSKFIAEFVFCLFSVFNMDAGMAGLECFCDMFILGGWSLKQSK